MTKLFLLIPLFLVQVSRADVAFQPAQKIMMTDKTCQALEERAQSIIKWTASIIKDTPAMPECFCSSTSCQMDVAPISPYFVRQMTNFVEGAFQNVSYDGPNCFNSALVATQSLPNIVYTDAYEMTAVTQSPLCTERKIDEALQPGDVLVVRNPNDPMLNVHAGIYLDDVLSFSKYGQQNIMPYSYGLNVARSYGVSDPQCLRLEGAPKPGDHCYGKFYVNYFSCTPIYSFVSKILKEPGGLVESARDIYARTSDFDLKLSGIVYRDRPVDVPMLVQLQTDLRALYEQSAAVEKDPALNDGSRALVRLMRAHIYSLFEQTRILAGNLNEPALIHNTLPPPL